MNIDRLTTPQRISAISIIVIAVAAFLPWVSIFGISVVGIRGDGVMTLLMAVAGGVILVMTTGLLGNEDGTPGKKSQIALLVLAILTALIGLLDMNGAAAIGLYLTFFGGVAWVVGAAWQLSLSRVTTATQPRASE